eukprot:CAMPEP_0119004680 /NCGR_PEP_ID=MMETSP1176-20130426/1288_1 /TAXON_ID=265551 /ORGANISM="Synedropsis recta cf, Strain CCMP1620" /LENGTH=127 /DNA_ID=CAMNT_0006956415 /DNA_START=62 /DNA_END=445 /DNA_ORIENTATION=+
MKTVIAFTGLIATAAAFAPAASRSMVTKLAATATEETFTQAEKDKITDNVFDCHGFFPDLRADSELPAEVLEMREQPKPAEELKEIKAKYAAMSKPDAAFAILVDLGLMENYDKLGDYSDDFDDYAM